jgi:hypothetical protein
MEGRVERILTDNSHERLKAVWDGERFALVHENKGQQPYSTVSMTIILTPEEMLNFTNFAAKQLAEFYSKAILKDKGYLTKSILLQQHRDAGMTLEEDDHIVYLKLKDAVLARFSIHASIEEIRHEADQQLEWLRSGIEFKEG